MNYNNLLATLEDGILTVTINRPKKLNALNGETMNELGQVFGKDALAIDGLKGVIVTGSGDRAFVAGADIKEFLDNDKSLAVEQARRGHNIFFLIEDFPKPVIAAVNGYALGGGCELAMACHIRIAGETARFGQPEVNLGIIPGYGGTQRLTQLVGKGKAMELIMTSDMIGAEEAKALGLANHVVSQGEEVAKAREIIEKIATKAPVAISKVIESVNAVFEKDKDGYDVEANTFGECFETDDWKEGVTAFLEKRKANFTGK